MKSITHIGKVLLGTTALTATTFVGMASTAMAQSLDEIIVTATRRAENVQDIPIAVTAVTAAQLETQGVTDITDLQSVSASFNIQSSQTESQGTSIRLRGVGTTGNNIGLESAVGVFIDGVYQSRPGVALGELVDVEAVEVLRGPQGTLFGRNTTAGALNVKTKAPDLSEFGGFADVSYGNFNLVNVQGAVNIPLATDKAALRFTGAYRNRDGFLDSTIQPGEENLTRDRLLLKGQALVEPTDNISVRVIADYQTSDENCCAAVTLTTSPNLSAASTAQFFPAVGFEDSFEDRRFNSQQYENNIDQWGVSAEVVWDLGGPEFTGIVSYRDFVGESRQDDFGGALVYSVTGATFPEGTPATFDEIQTFTAEARLQGEAMDGRLDWLIGAYYADEQIEEQFALGLGADFSTAVSEANFGNPAILGLVSAGGAFFASGQNPAAFAPVSSDGSFSNNQFLQDASSFSVFTHNIFEVTDNFDLTVGLRYVDDSKDGTYNQLEANNPACLAGLALNGALTANAAGAAAALAQFGPVAQAVLTNPAIVGPSVFLNCFPFAAPALGVAFLPSEFDEEFNDEELIYTVKGSYKFTEDALLYGSFTHGYKAGGFNLDSTAAAGGADPSFLSEEIDAWELGLKTTLFDNRVRANIALFHSTLDNFQVLEFTGTQFQTFNVNDVSSTGGEFEAVASITDALTADIALTYTDAEYGDDCSVGVAIPNAATLCGFPLTNAPEFVAVGGLNYDTELEGGWGLTANVSGRYESDRRTSTQPQVAIGVLNPLDIQESNFKLNARLGITLPNDRVSFEFWGVNVFDERTRGITFNTPLQGASRSAFIQDPRTYGVTMRTNF